MNQPSRYYLLFTFLASASANLGFLFFDYNLSIFNNLLPYLSDYIFPGTSSGVITFIASAPIITAAIAAAAGGPLAAKYGRRKLMIIFDFIGIAGVILTLFASLPVIILGRLLIGFHLGNSTIAVPLYFSELPPPEHTGPMGVGPSFIGSLGVVAAFSLGLIVPTTLAPGETSETWRILQAVSIIFNVWRIINFLVFFKFETPQFLISQNRIEEAEKALSQVYKTGVKERIQELIKDRDYVRAQGTVGLAQIFSKKYLRALIVAIVIMSIQHLGGFNIVLVFSKTIFAAGIDDEDDMLPSYLSIALSIVFHISCYFVIYSLNKFGRKTLLVGGTFCLGILEIIFGVISKASDPSSIAAKIFMVLWPLPFAFSLGSVPNIVVPETLPEIGVSIASLTNWIWGFLTVQFFPDITDAIGVDGAFLIMGGLCILASIYFWIELVETKGKSKAEILQQYNKMIEIDTTVHIPVAASPAETTAVTPVKREHQDETFHQLVVKSD